VRPWVRIPLKSWKFVLVCSSSFTCHPIDVICLVAEKASLNELPKSRAVMHLARPSFQNAKIETKSCWCEPLVSKWPYVPLRKASYELCMTRESTDNLAYDNVGLHVRKRIIQTDRTLPCLAPCCSFLFVLAPRV
jgi:hypothetical protein